MAKYVAPNMNESAFNCPHCGALAVQTWYSCRASELAVKTPSIHSGDPPFIETTVAQAQTSSARNINFTRCFNCRKITVWIAGELYYPRAGGGPEANPDLPPDIRKDYDEASAILEITPRGAAALLRLCIQKLCVHLGQPGQNLNADIKALVAAGLDVGVQQALDYVRVVGNNAVHPGEIDVDDRATAEMLFRLVNIIAEKMITQPKHVEELYGSLPPGVLKAIEKRDGKASPAASDNQAD